jgi:chromosome segregation ATPase
LVSILYLNIDIIPVENMAKGRQSIPIKNRKAAKAFRRLLGIGEKQKGPVLTSNQVQIYPFIDKPARKGRGRRITDAAVMKRWKELQGEQNRLYNEEDRLTSKEKEMEQRQKELDGNFGRMAKWQDELGKDQEKNARERSQYETTISDLNGIINDLKEKKKAIDITVSNQWEEISRLQKQAKLAEEKNAALEKEKVDVTNLYNATKLSVLELKNRVNESEARLNEVTRKQEQLENEKHALEGKLKDASARFGAKSKQVLIFRNRLNIVENELESVGAGQDAAEREVEKLQGELSDKNSETRKLLKEREDLDSQLKNSYSNEDSLLNLVRVMERTIQEGRAKAQQLEEQRSRIQEQLSGIEAQLPENERLRLRATEQADILVRQRDYYKNQRNALRTGKKTLGQRIKKRLGLGKAGAGGGADVYATGGKEKRLSRAAKAVAGGLTRGKKSLVRGGAGYNPQQEKLVWFLMVVIIVLMVLFWALSWVSRLF